MATTQDDRIAGISSGVAIKAPVRVATSGANIVLSGLQTVDGVSVVAADRVLVKDQTDQTQNGIYVANTSAWTRDFDFDGARDAIQGTLVLVTAGTVSGGVIYECTTANPITIGTSSIQFSVYNVGSASPTTITVVDSHVAAKALAVPSGALTVLIRGYSTPGDGGGGFYWWNVLDTTADNGGTVLALTANGANPGRLNKLF